LIIVVVAPRVPMLKRVPGPLLGLVVVTVLQATMSFSGIATIGTAFGGIPAGLPSLQMPEVTAARVIELIGPAFAIAMLGAIESLLSAVVADGMAGTRHDSNQELIGQGIANIVAPLFGGFAATGAIARTATNVRNGGTSPLAGIVHALTLVLVILFLAPLAMDVPLAALSAILFVVAWNMSEARHFVRPDVVVLRGAVHRHHRPADAGGGRERSAAAQGACNADRRERTRNSEAGEGRHSRAAGARQFLQRSAACAEPTPVNHVRDP
jgi:SulP family sulfate permease